MFGDIVLSSLSKNSRALYALGFGTCALFTHFASADNGDTNALFDLPLDQLVNVEISSASRYKQKSSEAPSAVEVWTARDIVNFGWRTLADALNATRGLYVRDDRNYSYLGVRGLMRPGDFYSRVLIMVDGRRMNDAIYDSGNIDEEFMLDMNLIDRIEYIPGSGSSVYGANALLGVINVVTKKGKDFNGGKLYADYGSQNTYRVRGAYGKTFDNGLDVMVNASQYASDGAASLYFPEYAADNHGFAQNIDHEQSSRVFTQMSYRNLTFHGGYSDRFKQVPTASFGTIFNDPYNYTDDSSAYMDLDYNSEVADKLNLQLSGFDQWKHYYAPTPYYNNVGQRVVNYDSSYAHWWGGEVKLTGTQFDAHKWVSGVEFQYDATEQLLNYDENPYRIYTNTNRQGTRIGLYAQDEYLLFDNLRLNAGARLDQNHMINGLQLNPRVGLIWEATSSLTGKLLYSSAFRAPNVYERDSNAPGNRANPSNRQELITSYEAVAEWRPGDGVRLLGTVFLNNLNKLLIQDQDPASPTYLMFINAGKFNAHGFEFSAEKQWENNRMLKFTWTHTNTQSLNPGGANGWAPASPNNLVKAHYAEPLFDNRWRLGVEEIFVDEQLTLQGNIAPSYHLLDINLALTKPYHGFQVALGMYNALDQQYKSVGSPNMSQDTIVMNGRTFRLRLEYGF